MSEILERKPIRTWLKNRPTIVLEKPLIAMLESGLFEGQVALPAGVTPEEAIEVVARSEWARKLAEGVCGPKYAGFTPGTPEFEACVYNVSHKVAARVLGLTWTPTPPTRPTRRRRTR